MLNKRKVSSAVLASGLAVALLGACGSSSKSSSPASSGGSSSSGNTPSGNKASDTGVSASTIKLGYISSLTGVASSTFADGPAGAKAAIDAINASGGINGRQIQLIVDDDQSSPTADATAAKDLIQKGVFGVIDYSSFTFGGARALQQAGVPVTGYSFDGPEWGMQPYSNMFSWGPPFFTPYSGKYYNYDYYGKFLQQVGVTKTAGLAFADSPSSIASIKAAFKGGANNGVSQCYANYSVPFGGQDFTTEVLAMKNSGCNGVVASFVDSSDVALSTALKQSGVQSKNLFYTGYDQSTLSSSAAQQAFEGSYFSNPILFDPTVVPAVQTMYNNLQKSDSSYKPGSIPDFGMSGSYVAADLMIKGLQLAGTNPTRHSFITALRAVTNYDAGGLLPSPTSFANFGTPEMLPNTACSYFVQLKAGKFVPAVGTDGKICGQKISFSS